MRGEEKVFNTIYFVSVQYVENAGTQLPAIPDVITERNYEAEYE